MRICINKPLHMMYSDTHQHSQCIYCLPLLWDSGSNRYSWRPSPADVTCLPWDLWVTFTQILARCCHSNPLWWTRLTVPSPSNPPPPTPTVVFIISCHTDRETCVNLPDTYIIGPSLLAFRNICPLFHLPDVR